ncbi:hypothetical protein Glove_110g116 [Diversispora epigaea]|uniref:DUF659 domain-containing protein n=1 Tax=Diversispora epigaea TaxID=1348612 RepID=A0A397JBA8_9GLOM|nr:hypothetical protein Glove_110g116 [Diversispora epigaea]
MIVHLALQCPKPPPPEVRALYLEILNNGSFDDNDDDNSSKRSKPYKQSKITNHVERLTVTDNKQRRYFQVPKRTILSTTMINIETATVIAEMKRKLSNKTNLTLGLDGWTSPADQSLYIFLIMTSDEKEYIHSLKNFSKNSHTEEFLKNEIIKVIEEVGAEKFCSIVSDHASNVVLAKNLVSTKYPHIFPIRCIAHHINLLSSDIIKLNWATNIITCCKKIITFFKQSHAGGAILQQEIVENMIKGDSIIRCKNALKQILENESQLLNLEIISILQKQNFFRNVKDLRTILLPIKKAIINLEHKLTTLADYFINLVIMTTAIKELSQTNTGLQINTFRIICEKVLSIWKLLEGREKSANELIAQISNYSLKSKPYDFEFVTGIHTCKQQNNHIQKLALLMASIVPSNASCERYFSILGWYMNKRRTSLNCSLLQNMLQMHAYYVSNISNEIKHAIPAAQIQNPNAEIPNAEIPNPKSQITISIFCRNPKYYDEGFEDAVTKTTFSFDDEIFDENDDELENNQFKNDDELENNQFENNESENQISNSQNFDSFFNVTDIELRRVLEIEVTVEIPLSTEYTDSGEQDFNIESIINKSLERRESGINNITE